MHRLIAIVLVLSLLAACGEPVTFDDDLAGSASTTATTAAGAADPTSPPTATATATSTSSPTATPAPTQTPDPTATPQPTETSVPPTAEPAATIPGREALVVEVVDGDTLNVMLDGRQETVRLIGVDTPETKDPREPVQCFGAEATVHTQLLIDRAGGRVFLEQDVSETDRYGRLLRYVWLPHDDGARMLNYELVAQGYAQSSSYPPDVKYQDLFREAERTARAQGLGLWGACGGFGVPLKEPTPVPVAPLPPPATGDCDPAYPDVCIPPPSVAGDLDCGDISPRRFAVLPPDPHGFDRDSDGIGCESD